MAKWSPGKRLVVLGAGATRGAKWNSPVDKSPACLPPLNADFFTQLQRLREPKHDAIIESVINDVVDLYGPGFSLTLEDYFSQLQSMISMADVVDRQKSELWNRSELLRKRKSLVDAVGAVLEESADTTKSESNAFGGCAHHDRLFEALEVRDSVVSFNYDCVADHSLRRAASDRWNAAYGYAFGGSFTVEHSDRWNGPNSPSGQNSSINMLKLHGSMNWFPFREDESVVRLRQRTYNQNGSIQCEIVPPEQSKSIDADPRYRKLWGHAELAIRKCEVAVLIGFSFTPTDLHVAALFRGALRENGQLKKLVIVNPSREHRQFVRKIFQQPLRNGALVVQFDTLGDFAPHAMEVMGG